MISKTVEINSGKNIIDIAYDGFVLCLRISKTIIADFYDDSLGTMGRYFVLNSDYDRDKYIKNLNDVLIDGTDEIILEKIIDFLNLFNSGTYCVYTSELNLDYYKIRYDYSNLEGAFYNYNYTVDFRNLMFTQPSTSISRERVDYYKGLIKSGYKPRVLIIGHNNLEGISGDYINTEFILDGHHKLLAYSELRVPCNYVRIEKESMEDEIYKKNLFNSYSYFLNEELKAEIIGNNPKMHIENSEGSVKYNIEFDNYLRTFQKYISADVYKLIFKSINSINNEEKKWGLSKLRIIEKKDFSKEKLILWNVINEHLSLSYREIKSKEEFNYFVLETFGRSLDDIEKNIT